MRTLIITCATFALGLSAFGVPAAQARGHKAPQQRLDALLAGRVAGKPIDCISLIGNNDTQVIDGTAIVYGSGGTIYVNRPTNAASLTGDDILVSDIRGTDQLCQLQVIQLRDRTSGFYDGFVTLNDFTPYTREGNGR